MTSTNPLTVGSGVISTYRNGLLVTNNRLGQRIMPSEDGTYHRKEDRDSFIERMKEKPHLWGSKVTGLASAVSTEKGYVSIFHADGHLSRTYYFNSCRKKKEVISSALRQIKHLRCCYIEIKYK